MQVAKQPSSITPASPKKSTKKSGTIKSKPSPSVMPTNQKANDKTSQLKNTIEKKVTRPRQMPQQKLPPDPLNNIRAGQDKASMVVRRSYVMVISSYENVARHNELTGSSADQLGETIQRRIQELNPQTRRQIEDLPEYKKLDIEDINELGDELADMMTDEDEYLKAFALLKNPVFAELMESTENVHRSFAEMMQDNGDEKLMFGALEMVNNMGGLSALGGKGKASQGVNIKV